MTTGGEVHLSTEELSSLIAMAVHEGPVHIGFTCAVLLDTPENAWAVRQVRRWRRAAEHDDVATDDDTQPMTPVRPDE